MDIVKKNVILMLERRGFTTLLTENNEYFFAQKDSEVCIFVYFVNFVKVNIDKIKFIISSSKFNDKLIKHIILIHAKSLTPDAENVIRNTVFKIETFTFEEFYFDLVEIIAPHKIYNGSPLKEKNKLPIILESDMVSRYFGFTKGQIIEILEDDGIISLRRCVR